MLACPPLAVPRRDVFTKSSGEVEMGKEGGSVECFEVAAVQSQAPRARIPFIHDM